MVVFQVSSAGIQALVCAGCGAPSVSTTGYWYWSHVLCPPDSCVSRYSPLHWTAGPTEGSLHTAGIE